MINNYPGEKWKTVIFDFKYGNNLVIQVSNFGRIKSINKIHKNGNILKGSLINGYKIIRLKFYRAREEKEEKKLLTLQKQVLKLSKELRILKEENENKAAIAEAAQRLSDLKIKLKRKFTKDLNQRVIHYHSLVHRLVATYFLTPPTNQHTVVGHLDFDKLNNRASNLKWMTPEENIMHQQKSPHVIKEKQDRKFNNTNNFKNLKLTVTKVMLLKKLLNEGKPVKQLAKNFKVTETQIFRIKRGENWGDIAAAN